MQGLGYARVRVCKAYVVQNKEARIHRNKDTPDASDNVGFLCHVVLKKSFFYDNPLLIH
jgi:hypothetical protein